MDKLKKILETRFGYSEFKEGQRETIESILEGQDTLAVLPTATGKSLCYQLTSYCLPGTTLVVSPLISLMEDQVHQLYQMGEKKAVAINSLMDFRQRQYVLKRLAFYKFIFVSPETLANSDVLNHLKQLEISLFVVDEAHCISQWGTDFRPDYLMLKNAKKELNCQLTLALTATATPRVIEDIQQQLFRRSFKLIQLPITRDNIYLKVYQTEEKIKFLISFLNVNFVPGIIYFASKAEAERIAKELGQQLNRQIEFYHGDVDNEDRLKIQQQFINGDIQILCATSAFGMGINKADIRFVIHYHLPDSLENYVQEFGRAGRDGEPSVAIMLYQSGDEQIHRFLHEDSYTQKKELLFLKDKDPVFIENKGIQLTDLQAKWLNQIVKTKHDWPFFEQQLEIKRHSQTTNLEWMLKYINLKICRKKFIQDYFDGGKVVESVNEISFCCDNCNDQLPELKNKSLEQEQKLKNLTAQQIIKNLFLL